MIKHYFSPSTLGFYNDKAHGPLALPEEQSEREIKAGKRAGMVPNPDTLIPEDAIEISEQRREELLNGQANGKVIELRGTKPVLVDAAIPAEGLKRIRRKERDRRLAASDWTQLSDVQLSGDDRNAWATYRQQLRDLDMDGEGWPVAPNEETG